MSPLAIVVALAATLAVMFIVVFFASGPSTADAIARRLSRYGGQPPEGEPELVAGEEASGGGLRDALARATGSLNLDRGNRGSKLSDDLQRADLKIRSSEWMLAVIGTGVLVGLILWLRYSQIWLFAVGVAGIWFLSGVYLRARQRRRARAFNNQLGDTILLLSNALKAGYSFSQALATVAKSSGPPIGDECARAAREIQLGIPVDDALNHMVERNQSEDFDLLITAVQIQRVAGGNLAEILDNIAETIRERVRIQGEIRTLTAQARLSGWIITLLPIALAAILSFISPDYFRPMFSKDAGRAMLLIAGFSMALGVALIQKIVKIEV